MSKKIRFHDEDKLAKINKETLKLFNKYKVDMTLRELSEKLSLVMKMIYHIGSFIFMIIKVINVLLI